VYQELKRYREAILDYQRAIELEPDNALHHNNLAGVYLEMRELREARREFEKRVEMRPDDALNAYVCLGIIARYEGEENKSTEYFERALAVWDAAWKQQIQSPASLLENKAIALLCLGRREASLQTLQEARTQLRRDDTVDLDYYQLLSESPHPPEGLDELIALVRAMESRKPE